MRKICRKVSWGIRHFPFFASLCHPPTGLPAPQTQSKLRHEGREVKEHDNTQHAGDTCSNTFFKQPKHLFWIFDLGPIQNLSKYYKDQDAGTHTHLHASAVSSLVFFPFNMNLRFNSICTHSICFSLPSTVLRELITPTGTVSCLSRIA